MKKFYIVRGLPGSGKSTIAKLIAEATGALHFEADMIFIDPITQEYKFDPNKLGYAHKWCLDQCDRALAHNHSCVVSNTFTTQKELNPYLELARNHGIIPNIILSQSEFGSIHGVPEDKMEAMRNRFLFKIDLDDPKQTLAASTQEVDTKVA